MKITLLALSLLCLSSTAFSQLAKRPVNDGIETARIPSVNMDSFRLHEMAVEIEKGIFPNIHSVLIARHNKLVFEQYWPGEDEVLGEKKGVVKHDKQSLHDCRSVSKSIVSACIGIAIAQGKIRSVDQKVFDFFPEFKKYDTGWKSALTLQHLLTMTSGLVWNEDVPYDNPENSEIQMTKSANPNEYVLMQPMEVEAGKVWKYNGGTTQLLSTIIEKVSGKKVDQFANAYLFQPLRITKFEWIRFPGTNIPMAASGLRLSSRSLLKFGMLYNNNGKWNGKQVLPAGWIEKSFTTYVNRGREGEGYGYQFWFFNEQVGDRKERVVAAVGNGDQRIFFDKKRDLVVVVTAGNYNKWDIPKNAHVLVSEFIKPAVIPD